MKPKYKKVIKFNEIPLGPFTNKNKTQRDSSEDSRINPEKLYLALVDGTLRSGYFCHQWYGWLLETEFHDQLNMIERLWEMEE